MHATNVGLWYAAYNSFDRHLFQFQCIPNACRRAVFWISTASQPVRESFVAISGIHIQTAYGKANIQNCQLMIYSSGCRVVASQFWKSSTPIDAPLTVKFRDVTVYGKIILNSCIRTFGPHCMRHCIRRTDSRKKSAKIELENSYSFATLVYSTELVQRQTTFEMIFFVDPLIAVSFPTSV